jgi:hypothetical protein
MAFHNIQWDQFGGSTATGRADVVGCAGQAPCEHWTGTARFVVFSPGRGEGDPASRIYRCLEITSSTGTALRQFVGAKFIVSGNFDEHYDLCGS